MESTLARRFSAAAGTYDRHAQPQRALARAVASLLPSIRPGRILELGAGTGLLTRLLAGRFPGAPIDAVDLAPRMVARGRAAFSGLPHIRWIEADAQAWRGGTYPLAASSAALHWAADLRRVFANVFECLEPGGCFALGMMLEGTLKELRDLRRDIAPGKASGSPLPSLDATAAALEGAGFRIETGTHSVEQFTYADARAFLQAIHEQGVTGGKVGRGGAPLNRGELGRLVARYQQACATDGGVYATYETAAFLLAKA